MAEAAAAGVAPHLFWDYTYRELHALMRGSAIRARRQHQLAIFGAYQGERFARTKRLPDLKALLRKFEPVRVMSREALKATVLGIAQAMGAVVVRRPKKRE